MADFYTPYFPRPYFADPYFRGYFGPGNYIKYGTEKRNGRGWYYRQPVAASNPTEYGIYDRVTTVDTVTTAAESAPTDPTFTPDAAVTVTFTRE